MIECLEYGRISCKKLQLSLIALLSSLTSVVTVLHIYSSFLTLVRREPGCEFFLDVFFNQCLSAETC